MSISVVDLDLSHVERSLGADPGVTDFVEQFMLKAEVEGAAVVHCTCVTRDGRVFSGGSGTGMIQELMK